MANNTKLLKGSLINIILKLLGDNDKMYGYEITKKVKELTNGQLSLTEGALYPTLHKLEAEGLLSADVEHIDNRPRKYYSLTKTGKKEAAVRLESFKTFVTQMQLVLNLNPAIK